MLYQKWALTRYLLKLKRQRQKQCKDRKWVSHRVIPLSLNLATHFSSSADRCAWPFPQFSVTGKSDSSQQNVSLWFLSLLLIVLSIVTSHIHSMGSSFSIHLHRKMEGKKQKHFEFWCVFVNIFRSNLWWKWLKTSWNHNDAYTHPHNNTMECTVTLQLLQPSHAQRHSINTIHSIWLDDSWISVATRKSKVWEWEA